MNMEKQTKKRLSTLLAISHIPIILFFIVPLMPAASGTDDIIPIILLLICTLQILVLFYRLKWQLKHPLRLSRINQILFIVWVTFLILSDIAAIFENQIKFLFLLLFLLIFLINTVFAIIQISTGNAKEFKYEQSFQRNNITLYYWLSFGFLFLLNMILLMQIFAFIPEIIPYRIWNLVAFFLILLQTLSMHRYPTHHPMLNNILATILFKTGITLFLFAVLFRDLHWPFAGIGLAISSIIMLVGYLLSFKQPNQNDFEEVLDRGC